MTSPKEGSVPKRRGKCTVMASPFNAIKFELIIILFLGIGMVVLTEVAPWGMLTQILILAGYAALASLWLLIKTHRELKRHEKNQQ